MKSMLGAAGALALRETTLKAETMAKKPNVLFIMCDQMRADTIAALGNPHIYTPNFDRLVKRGISFTKAYSTCPVCIPARYTIRTGRDPATTCVYQNGGANLVEGQPEKMEDRCGDYLARTMGKLGYRTFGIGKFHSVPRFEDLGFDVHLHSEEIYHSPADREKDAYASFIAKEHPEYAWVEMLMGERTDMYYQPQMSPLPAELGVETWAADRTVDQIKQTSNKPYFGFVSFIGPHPPLAPPQPFNRMYNPDRMPNPIKGDIAIDHMDEQIPWMNYVIWANDINDTQARTLLARYYGEITYIDRCLGRILDAVEARPDADNTLICFFADHGDHMGDHNAWQKESFFEASCKVPFLISWPDRLPKDTRREQLVCLTDLFGIATHAAGRTETRDGIDVLSLVDGKVGPREYVVGCHGPAPGSQWFKVMARDAEWKYIYIANGGREQLFNLKEDPNELTQRISERPDVADRLRQVAIQALSVPNADRALDGGGLRSFPYEKRPATRIRQFDRSSGVTDFPEHPADVLKQR